MARRPTVDLPALGHLKCPGLILGLEGFPYAQLEAATIALAHAIQAAARRSSR